MGLLKRFWQILNTDIKMVMKTPEDPENILEETLLEMQQELISIRKAIAHSVSSEKKNERHYLEHQQKAKIWYNRAQLALMQNNEHLAQEALRLTYEHLELTKNLQNHRNQQQELIEKLKKDLNIAQVKIEEIKNKKDVYLARESAAEQSLKIQKITYDLKEGNSFKALGKIEEQVWQQEAEIDISEEKTLDNLELQFRAMENSNQEQLLNNINKKQNLTSSFSEIRVTIEEELKQLRSDMENLE